MQPRTVNCFACRHMRLTDEGNFVECHHPSMEEFDRRVMAETVSNTIQQFSPKDGPLSVTIGFSADSEDGIKVVVDSIGIRRNWAYWPVVFDPVWLRFCSEEARWK